MGLGLVDLPEELISEIIEDVAVFHDPPARPSKAGFQCLLDDSSVAALSLTCQKIRRLALPILFRSLRIAPGFISENTIKGFVEKEDMLPIVDALRTINPWRTECVKHLHIFHCKGDLQAFAVDILSMFPALERIELSAQLWDDASVLKAVHNHPTLQRCTFPHVNWVSSSGDVSLPYPDMHKVYWRSFTVTVGNNSYLQKFLEVGLQIEQLMVVHTSLEWAKLKFTSALRSIYVIADIAERCSLLWDFVIKHPSVNILELKQESTAAYLVGKINPEITSMLEEGPVSRVRSALLVRKDNKWRVEDVHIDIIYTDQDPHLDDFSGKLQRFGRYLPGLVCLSLSIAAPNEMPLLPGLPLERVFKQAVSTMKELKDLSIMLPSAITAYFEAQKHALNLQPEHVELPNHVYNAAALQLSHSIATSAPELDRITYLNLPMRFSASAGYRQFVVLVERNPEVQVFEGEMRRDSVHGGMEFVAIGKPWVSAGVL